ncbi:MAG: RNA polymerase sigma factor [Candidatus Saccharibacteria bacterium]|nr:RNA polymerase sigma factor [Rhodoferax sp.]
MTPEEILKKIVAGGRDQNEALRALYQTKASAFKRWFLHKGVHPGAAEDVLQDTIVKIFKSAESYHGQGGFSDSSASAWMHTIAFSCMQDHFEKANRIQQTHTSYDDMPDPSKVESDNSLHDRAYEAAQSTDTQSVNECIAAGLEDFAAEQPDRYEVLMAQMDGEDIASIGNRIGRTVAATKEYLSQCRKKLAPFIEHCTPLLPA